MAGLLILYRVNWDESSNACWETKSAVPPQTAFDLKIKGTHDIYNLHLSVTNPAVVGVGFFYYLFIYIATRCFVAESIVNLSNQSGM